MRLEFDTDTVSAFVKRATDILFLQNPIGTSLGLLIGVVCHGIAPVVSKVIQVDLKAINFLVWSAAGVVICNIPTLLRGYALDPPIEAALTAIRKARKDGEISPAQARIMYVALYERVLNEVTLNRDVNDAVRRATKKADTA